MPVTVKIRLGNKSDRGKFVELCKLIEGEGGDCITIHARFDDDKFCRKPRWECIATAKKHLTIPIIANGGIFSVEDARKCFEISGADAIMLGRGAASKPWIFSEISETLFGIKRKSDLLLLRDIYIRFTALLNLRFSHERRLGRLKQFTHYFAESYPFGHRLASAVQTSHSMDEAIERAEHFFDSNEQLSY